MISWHGRETALDAVGNGPVVVVGNSIGGSCAIQVARLAPTKVKALVISGTKPGHDPDPALRDEALAIIERDGLRAAWEKYWLPLFGPNVQSEVSERGRANCVSPGSRRDCVGRASVPFATGPLGVSCFLAGSGRSGEW